eukprot:2326109-Rhodomonas_salina.3
MNGACVPVGQYKPVAYIQFNSNKGSSICTGILVTHSWILTAAHCLPEEDHPQVIAKIGCVDIYDDETCLQHAVTHMYPHPCYAVPGNHLADIMIMKLKNPVPSAKIQLFPVNGVTSQRLQTLAPLTSTVGVGFGYMDEKKSVRYLQSALAHAVHPAPCRHFSGVPSAFPPICVLESESENGNMCRGDSGGPLFMHLDGNETVYGILSSGQRRMGTECLLNPDAAECCVFAPRFVTYVDISHFAEWIQGVMDGTAASANCFVPETR